MYNFLLHVLIKAYIKIKTVFQVCLALNKYSSYSLLFWVESDSLKNCPTSIDRLSDAAVSTFLATTASICVDRKRPKHFEPDLDWMMDWL